MSETIFVDSRPSHAYIQGAMTAEDFRAALDEKGIALQVEAARALRVSQASISRWLSGEQPIPPIVRTALDGIKPQTAEVTRQTARGRSRKVNHPKH